MHVRMKVEVSGTRAGRDWPRRGETLELPDGEAAELCQAGLAVPVANDTTEAATAPGPEVRKGRRPAGKRGTTGDADATDEAERNT